MEFSMKINWTRTCCEWHGEYAEHPTTDGGVARLKRSPGSPGMMLVSRFGSDNKPIDKDKSGVPSYVKMKADDAMKLLA